MARSRSRELFAVIARKNNSEPPPRFVASHSLRLCMYDGLSAVFDSRIHHPQNNAVYFNTY
jgi:hypothetical protein